MTTTDLVPVFTGTLAGQSTPLCNARDLHAALGVGTKFEDWLPRRIAEYGFTEGEDFLSILRKTRGRPATDYHLTLDMAKELTIVENNEVGRRIRRYLIALEKDSRAATVPAKLPAPTPPRHLAICQAFRSMTQEQRLAAVESLIAEGLITVKIGPRGGSSLFLAVFE